MLVHLTNRVKIKPDHARRDAVLLKRYRIHLGLRHEPHKGALGADNGKGILPPRRARIPSP